jgi:hypothetical protein
MRKFEITKFWWQFTNAEVRDYGKRHCSTKPAFNWAMVEVERPSRKGRLELSFRHGVPRFELTKGHFLQHVKTVGSQPPFDGKPQLPSDEGTSWFRATYFFHLQEAGNDVNRVMRLFKDAMESLGVASVNGLPAAVISQRTEVQIRGIRIPFGIFKSAQQYPVLCPLQRERFKVKDGEVELKCGLCESSYSMVPIGGERGDEWAHPWGPTFDLTVNVLS